MELYDQLTERLDRAMMQTKIKNYMIDRISNDPDAFQPRKDFWENEKGPRANQWVINEMKQEIADEHQRAREQSKELIRGMEKDDVLLATKYVDDRLDGKTDLRFNEYKLEHDRLIAAEVAPVSLSKFTYIPVMEEPAMPQVEPKSMEQLVMEEMEWPDISVPDNDPEKSPDLDWERD